MLSRMDICKLSKKWVTHQMKCYLTNTVVISKSYVNTEVIETEKWKAIGNSN